MILISIKNKDRSNIPASQLFQPAIEESDDGQGDDEMDINNLEIVEQLALDHFSVFLREAQELADWKEKENLWKHPKRYDGRSKRTLKWRKIQEDLAKKDILLLVFDFIAFVAAKKKAHIEEDLTARTTEIGQELKSEMCVSEMLDTENLVSIHRNKMCC